MNLSDIADQYADRFLEKYSQRLLPSQLKALNAIRGCRTPASGMTLLECNGCQLREQKPLSCGHRHCNRCQNTDTSEWLQRQRQKLLPVEYFMVTF
ncbi:transposase zinc-binding domain-containing protein, partial [Endozoicomonas acroporae]